MHKLAYFTINGAKEVKPVLFAGGKSDEQNDDSFNILATQVDFL